MNDIYKVELIRNELTSKGFCVVRLYSEFSEKSTELETGLDCLAEKLRIGGTPHCARGMGGIVKIYGAACDPAAAEARMDDKARELHAGIIGLEAKDVSSGWDAVGILREDAVCPNKRKVPTDPRGLFFYGTGGTLDGHVDIDPGCESRGYKTEQAMCKLHPIFPFCIQSQLVCRTVPKGGATLIVVPGAYTTEMPSTTLFKAGKDFAVLNDVGYAEFKDKWVAVDQVQKGCIILWLSRTPHGNKLANHGIDPQRRVVYISWQDRRLVPEEEKVALKKRKLEAVYSGASTDHWSTQVPKMHRGSHYSNRYGETKVLYNTGNPPVYSEALAKKINLAF